MICARGSPSLPNASLAALLNSSFARFPPAVRSSMVLFPTIQSVTSSKLVLWSSKEFSATEFGDIWFLALEVSGIALIRNLLPLLSSTFAEY
jgi:hypothetical protein